MALSVSVKLYRVVGKGKDRRGRRPAIAVDVFAESRRPEFDVALWSVSMAAVSVAVPEASVHKHDGSMPWENYIRTAGEPGHMQPKATANSVENGTYLAAPVRYPLNESGTCSSFVVGVTICPPSA